MQRLIDDFQRKVDKLNFLIQDLQKLVAQKKKEVKEAELEGRPAELATLPESVSLKSLQRTSPMRKTEEDFARAEAEPFGSYVNDRLNEIFGD